jgi:hypothetical protein
MPEIIKTHRYLNPSKLGILMRTTPGEAGSRTVIRIMVVQTAGAPTAAVTVKACSQEFNTYRIKMWRLLSQVSFLVKVSRWLPPMRHRCPNMLLIIGGKNSGRLALRGPGKFGTVSNLHVRKVMRPPRPWSLPLIYRCRRILWHFALMKRGCIIEFLYAWSMSP